MSDHWSKPRIIMSASHDIALHETQAQVSIAENLEDGTVVGWHAHDFAQILSPAKGAVAVFVRDWVSVVPRTYAVLIPAGLLHTVVTNANTALRTICIASAHETLAESEAVHPVVRSLCECAPDIQSDTALVAPFLTDRAKSGNAEAGRFDRFLQGVPIPRDRRARPIAFRIVNALHDQRTLREWGETLGASERTLTRIFHDEMGMSFRAWRIHLQIAGTIALLLDGHSVKHASLAAGYASPSAFIAAFRQATGQSPLKGVAR
jgi:AraC-like DNA-binding protein/quercetin dioxygenase-like cupin family protein